MDELKIFGSICYVLVPSAKRTKLEDKAVTGIFIGYSSQSKAYRIYIPDSRKVVVSRDVTVDESRVWNWEKGRADVDTKPQLSEVQADQIEEDSGEESDEEVAITGTRTLADVYDRCNLAQMEPSSYSEAA